MVMPFDDTAPSGNEVTGYDRDHTMLYICLLDRLKRGQDWRVTVRAFFGIDTDKEPARARCVYDSHLARATSLQAVPSFAMMQQLAASLKTIGTPKGARSRGVCSRGDCAPHFISKRAYGRCAECVPDSRPSHPADERATRPGNSPHRDVRPPFSCICTLRYYYDRNLLNRPVLRLF